MVNIINQTKMKMNTFSHLLDGYNKEDNSKCWCRFVELKHLNIA